jgi:hypothetical protein
MDGRALAGAGRADEFEVFGFVFGGKLDAGERKCAFPGKWAAS